MDVSKCMSVEDLSKLYQFDKIKNQEWHIQACSAKTGEGLMAGMEWLSEKMVYKKNTRFPINPYQDLNSSVSLTEGLNSNSLNNMSTTSK